MYTYNSIPYENAEDTCKQDMWNINVIEVPVCVLLILIMEGVCWQCNFIEILKALHQSTIYGIYFMYFHSKFKKVYFLFNLHATIFKITVFFLYLQAKCVQWELSDFQFWVMSAFRC